MNRRIKQIRKELKLTQDEFAKKVGISFSSVSKLEKGVNNPSQQTLRAICREFGISRYWLETGAGNMFEEYDVLHISEIAQILSGSVEESRINAIIQILEMPPEEFYAWQRALEAFRVYSRWKGEEYEKTPEQ